MSKVKILYVDLGVHEGQEIDRMLRILGKFENLELQIVGVEGMPDLYRGLKSKYKDQDNIKILKCCINRDGRKVKLYKGQNSTLSSSIYEDKNNVSKKHVDIKGKRLSDLIKEIEYFDKFDVKILKANIEGAEFEMLLDLEENNAFVFDIYLGTGSAPYSILKDMEKVESLKERKEEAKKIMDRNGIVSERFIGNVKRKQNVDIVAKIREFCDI